MTRFLRFALRRPPLRTAALLACSTVVVASSAHAQSSFATGDDTQPQLVVLVTVDQLRPDYFERWGDEFTGGLARFWNAGAVFTNAAGVQDPQSPLV